MLKILISFYLILFSVVTFAQVDSSIVVQTPDTIRLFNRHGSFAFFMVAEAFIVGASYYAAKPNAYGDKVIGWLYAGSAAAMLIHIPLYWNDQSSKPDPDFRKHRIWNTVTMVGLGYGFSRIATYNLLKADGDPFQTRFKRNLIESHAAYFVPVLTGILTQRWLFRNKPDSRVQTNLQFDGSNLYLTMRFK